MDVYKIGKILKELRIDKNLTIDDVQEKTKIRSRYIQAIEEGNIDRLPGRFYAKAFVKAYAEVVDLDPLILEQYQESFQINNMDSIEINPSYSYVETSRSRWGKWFTVSLVYILIGLILLVSYIFYVSYSSNHEDLQGKPIGSDFEITQSPDNQNSGKESNQTDTTGNEKTDKEPIQQPEAVLDITKDKTTTYNFRPMDIYNVSVSVDAKVVVKLNFTDKCWIDIRENDENGKQLQSLTLDNGQTSKAFILYKQLWIHLGNASGTEIYINDKKISAGTETGPKYISLVRKTSK